MHYLRMESWSIIFSFSFIQCWNKCFSSLSTCENWVLTFRKTIWELPMFNLNQPTELSHISRKDIGPEGINFYRKTLERLFLNPLVRQQPSLHYLVDNMEWPSSIENREIRLSYERKYSTKKNPSCFHVSMSPTKLEYFKVPGFHCSPKLWHHSWLGDTWF